MQAKNDDFDQIFFIGLNNFLTQKSHCLESNLKENLVFSFQYTDKCHLKLSHENTDSPFAKILKKIKF